LNGVVRGAVGRLQPVEGSGVVAALVVSTGDLDAQAPRPLAAGDLVGVDLLGVAVRLPGLGQVRRDRHGVQLDVGRKLHEGRHSAASLARDAAVDPEIRRRTLGHADAAMTAHYTHIEAEAHKAAAEAVAKLVEAASS